jgi:hypothetical protein
MPATFGQPLTQFFEIWFQTFGTQGLKVGQLLEQAPPPLRDIFLKNACPNPPAGDPPRSIWEAPAGDTSRLADADAGHLLPHRPEADGMVADHGSIQGSHAGPALGLPAIPAVRPCRRHRPSPPLYL